MINWAAPGYDKNEGYGRYSMATIRALARAGVRVMPVLNDQLREMPHWMLQLADIDLCLPTLCCMPPKYLPEVDGRLWCVTMFEAESIPDDWAPILNERCERVIVPCEHNARVFRSCGVTIPVHVVHGGTDPYEFPVADHKNNGSPYIFMCMGDRGSRKGQDLVWRAFWQAFGDSKDVRLIIKVLPDNLKFIDEKGSDRRISIWRNDAESMASVYPAADCFVFPSRGEGWGMPPREAAMMGIPTIITRYAGLEVGADNWAMPVNKLRMEPSILLKGGMWASADVDELSAKMRWCYDHKTESGLFGLKAAQWLRDHQTWDHSAGHLIDLLEEVA
jgi:glycosyltransferase involved in cell wall biosynthesis